MHPAGLSATFLHPGLTSLPFCGMLGEREGPCSRWSPASRCCACSGDVPRRLRRPRRMRPRRRKTSGRTSSSGTEGCMPTGVTPGRIWRAWNGRGACTGAAIPGHPGDRGRPTFPGGCAGRCGPAPRGNCAWMFPGVRCASPSPLGHEGRREKARRVSGGLLMRTFIFSLKKRRKTVGFHEHLCYSQLGAAEKRQAVWPPAHVRGRFLPPDLRKGGLRHDYIRSFSAFACSHRHL